MISAINDRAFDVVLVADPENHVHTAGSLDRPVDDVVVGQFGIGNDHSLVVGRFQLGCEYLDGLDNTENTGTFDRSPTLNGRKIISMKPAAKFDSEPCRPSRRPGRRHREWQ
jgi:hypothetical protein